MGSPPELDSSMLVASCFGGFGFAVSRQPVHRLEIAQRPVTPAPRIGPLQAQARRDGGDPLGVDFALQASPGGAHLLRPPASVVVTAAEFLPDGPSGRE